MKRRCAFHWYDCSAISVEPRNPMNKDNALCNGCALFLRLCCDIKGTLFVPLSRPLVSLNFTHHSPARVARRVHLPVHEAAHFLFGGRQWRRHVVTETTQCACAQTTASHSKCTKLTLQPGVDPGQVQGKGGGSVGECHGKWDGP